MSYQSGYQYQNVPETETEPTTATEDPLLSNDDAAPTYTTNTNNNTNPNQAPAPLSSQQQQQHVQQYATTSSSTSTSPYEPRAYMTSYHEYIHHHGSHGNGSNNENNNGANPSYYFNNVYGNYSHSHSPFQYLQDERKRKRNKYLIIGIVAFLFLFMITHSSSSSSSSHSSSKTKSSNAISSSSNNTNGSNTEGNYVGKENFDSSEGEEEASSSSSTSTTTNNEEQNQEGSKIFHDNNNNSNSNNTTENRPKLTYLLTYPMSGTTFTMKIIEETTKMALAANFDQFEPYHDPTANNAIRPVCADYPMLFNGRDQSATTTATTSTTTATPQEQYYGYPFWTTSYEHGNLPKSHILTLSHCSGYCINPCIPQKYIHTSSSFEQSCRTITYFNKTQKEYNSYLLPIDAVDSVIHLIRDPMSNVVSRFHQFLILDEKEYNGQWKKEHLKKEEQEKEQPSYEYEGFRTWCNEMDHNATLVESEQQTQQQQQQQQRPSLLLSSSSSSHSFFSTEMKRQMKNIPCHSEFVKYILWHNHVVEMIWSKGYNAMEVFFEDFANVDRKLQVAKEMADFLGYGVADEGGGTLELPQFLGGKEYRNMYYTNEELEALKEFFELVAHKKTWELLTRYFA